MNVDDVKRQLIKFMKSDSYSVWRDNYKNSENDISILFEAAYDKEVDTRLLQYLPRFYGWIYTNTEQTDSGILIELTKKKQSFFKIILKNYNKIKKGIR